LCHPTYTHSVSLQRKLFNKTFNKEENKWHF